MTIVTDNRSMPHDNDVAEAGKALRNRILLIAAIIAATLLAVWFWGMLSKPADIGPFSIAGPKDTLINHAGFRGAMDAGEQLHLRVTLQDRDDLYPRFADYKVARSYEHKTGTTRVVVLVHPHDVFERRHGQWYYTPASPRPISNGRLL